MHLNNKIVLNQSKIHLQSHQNDIFNVFFKTAIKHLMRLKVKKLQFKF